MTVPSFCLNYGVTEGTESAKPPQWAPLQALHGSYFLVLPEKKQVAMRTHFFSCRGSPFPQIDKLVPERARLVMGLKIMSYKDRLKILSMVSLKRWQKSINIWEATMKMEICFQMLCRAGPGQIVSMPREIWKSIRKNFLTVQTVQHWNSLPRKVADSPLSDLSSEPA